MGESSQTLCTRVLFLFAASGSCSHADQQTESWRGGAAGCQETQFNDWVAIINQMDQMGIVCVFLLRISTSLSWPLCSLKKGNKLPPRWSLGKNLRRPGLCRKQVKQHRCSQPHRSRLSRLRRKSGSASWTSTVLPSTRSRLLGQVRLFQKIIPNNLFVKMTDNFNIGLSRWLARRTTSCSTWRMLPILQRHLQPWRKWRPHLNLSVSRL